MSLEIATLDAAIKMFSPSYRIQSIKPKRYQRKNSFFKHGEANRLILGILRDTAAPLSTNDIAKIVMMLKDIGAECEKPLQASILTTLHNHKKKGLVDFMGRDKSGSCIWALTG